MSNASKKPLDVPPILILIVLFIAVVFINFIGYGAYKELNWNIENQGYKYYTEAGNQLVVVKEEKRPFSYYFENIGWLVVISLAVVINMVALFLAVNLLSLVGVKAVDSGRAFFKDIRAKPISSQSIIKQKKLVTNKPIQIENTQESTLKGMLYYNAAYCMAGLVTVHGTRGCSTSWLAYCEKFLELDLVALSLDYYEGELTNSSIMSDYLYDKYIDGLSSKISRAAFYLRHIDNNCTGKIGVLASGMNAYAVLNADIINQVKVIVLYDIPLTSQISLLGNFNIPILAVLAKHDDKLNLGHLNKLKDIVNEVEAQKNGRLLVHWINKNLGFSDPDGDYYNSEHASFADQQINDFLKKHLC